MAAKMRFMKRRRLHHYFGFAHHAAVNESSNSKCLEWYACMHSCMHGWMDVFWMCRNRLFLSMLMMDVGIFVPLFWFMYVICIYTHMHEAVYIPPQTTTQANVRTVFSMSYVCYRFPSFVPCMSHLVWLPNEGALAWALDPQLLLKQSALLNRLGFFSRTSLQQQSTDSLSPFKEILLRNIQEGSMGAVGKRGDQGHEEERSATLPTNPKPKNAFPVSNPDLVATWWLCKVRPL